MEERWYLQTKKADFNAIGEKFHISPILARIIRNRDISGMDDIQKYLNAGIRELSSPWLFKDMERAVDILNIKITSQNKIRILCDYDVDGICAGHILLCSLRDLGADVDIAVPHRVEDGYGINKNLILRAYEEDVDTIITCDNGIAASEQIAYAKSLGMTIIITDHHEVPFEEGKNGKVYLIPEADAVVNHKQADCPYPYKELCGAMVVVQLVRAIYESRDISFQKFDDMLAYAAIATVCDVVDLTGENRIVVRFGLERLRHIKDAGINALMDVCAIDKNTLGAYHLGFIIGPCLNASGRLDSAKKALALLGCNHFEEAHEKAEALKQLNEKRKSLTEAGVNTAISIAGQCKDKVLVIYLPEIHESIAGIIAGRIRERFYKPVIVLTDAETGLKGSGRSIEEYNMYEELSKVKELFTKFGGHKMAAGLSLKKENLDLLKIKLNQNCNLTEDDLYLKVWIDIRLPLQYITIQLMEELKLLEPYGKANTKPVFAEKDLKLNYLKILGTTGNVLKMKVENESCYGMDAVLFSRTQEFMEFLNTCFSQEDIKKAMKGQANRIRFSATFFPKLNEYRGNTQLQIVIDRFC